MQLKIFNSFFTKINPFKSNKPRFKSTLKLNTLNQDVFTRQNSELSFLGGGDLRGALLNRGYTEEQADFIINHRILKYKVLDPNDFDECVADMFLLDEDDKYNFIGTRENYDLNLDESFTAIAYDLTEKEVERMVDIKSKYNNLSATELALVSKFDLSEDEIEKYLNIANKTVTFEENGREQEYILPIDEAILCAKEKYNEAQIKRFAQLRTRTKDLKDKTVRGMGGEPMYPIEYVVDCIKQNRDDEEIKKGYFSIKRYEAKRYPYKPDISLMQYATKAREEADSLEKSNLPLYRHKIKSIAVKPSTKRRIPPLRMAQRIYYDIITDVLIDYNLLDKLPENTWYLINMGCEKEVYDTIKKATEKINSDKKPALEPYISNMTDSSGNIKTNSYDINLSKLDVGSKPVLVIKDNNSDEQFISYHGAIAKVFKKGDKQESKAGEFGSFCNLWPKIQKQILAKASDGFIFDLFDEDGKCIISSGLDKSVTGRRVYPFVGSNKDSQSTKRHYGNLLKKLKDKNALTPENILRIMPKDSTLSINPYITSTKGNMLYSISCEWYDSKGKQWQLRIHSQNLIYPPAKNQSNWITRLVFDNENCYQFDASAKGYNLKGAFTGEDSVDSHIEIPTPVENSLINDIGFQKTIRKISSEIFVNQKVSAIARKYKLNSNLTSDSEKIKVVIEDSLKNPMHYLEHREIVDELRRNTGMLSLR